MKKIMEKFKHLIGDHCESSSMRDVIEYAGISIDEPMVFGLDATMGFVFIDNSKRIDPNAKFNVDFPFFVGGKQDTITENSQACRILGLIIKKETFKSPEEAWKSSKNILDQDIPLIILVDMGFLSYFNWQEEFHFGMHSIVLCGYNESKESVYLCDNGFEEILEVPLDELKKARNSKYGSKYTWPNNSQFIIRKRLDGKKPPFPTAVKLSLQKVANNMRTASVNSMGLVGMKSFAKSIPNWQKMLKNNSNDNFSKIYLTFYNLYGYIDLFGTGGGLFRKLYSKFLKELIEHQEIIKNWNNGEIALLNNSYELIRESGDLWTLFAQEIKKGLDKDKENCLNAIDIGRLEEIIYEIIPLEEEACNKINQIKI